MINWTDRYGPVAPMVTNCPVSLAFFYSTLAKRNTTAKNERHLAGLRANPSVPYLLR